MWIKYLSLSLILFAKLGYADPMGQHIPFKGKYTVSSEVDQIAAQHMTPYGQLVSGRIQFDSKSWGYCMALTAKTDF